MISFRTANRDDAKLISILVNSAYRGESSKQGWTTEADLLDGQRTDVEEIQEIISTPDSSIEIVFDDTLPNEILGCVQLKNESEHKLYFGMITVKPSMQGKGLGKQLLKHIEELALVRHCKRIRMTVIDVRSELIEFYMRRGYRSTGVITPFPSYDPRFGILKATNLQFLEFEKVISST